MKRLLPQRLSLLPELLLRKLQKKFLLLQTPLLFPKVPGKRFPLLPLCLSLL